MSDPLLTLRAEVARIEADRLSRRMQLDATLAGELARIERERKVFLPVSGTFFTPGTVEDHQVRTLNLAAAKARHERAWRDLESSVENRLIDAWTDYNDATREDDH